MAKKIDALNFGNTDYDFRGGDVYASKDATDSDINICDEHGNVIAKLKDGHIKTKNFDSSNVSIHQLVTLADLSEYASNDDGTEFTESFSFQIDLGDKKLDNMILAVTGKYENITDDALPTIQFTTGGKRAWTSPKYIIANKHEYSKKEWRCVADEKLGIVNVSIDIPENVTLKLYDLHNYYSDKKGYEQGVQNSAHTWGFNLQVGWGIDARLGFQYIIVVPKRCKDGVWVCYHDDTLGTNITSASGAPSQRGSAFSEIESTELDDLYYTSAHIGNYDRIGIPKLEEFFKLCAKTGVHPIFSVHPQILSADYWQEIKDMAVKYGLLNKLNIKGGSQLFMEGQTFRYAYSVLGDDIESYGIDTDSTYGYVDSFVSEVGLDLTKCKILIEFSDPSTITSEMVDTVLSKGYQCGAVITGDYHNGEYMEKLMAMGVTEFTEGANYSAGLNW